MSTIKASGFRARPWLSALTGTVWLLGIASVGQAGQTPGVLEALEEFPHAVAIEREEPRPVLDHQVGLGALQKHHGDWEFRASERYTGELTRETFQVVDGYAATQVLADMERLLEESGSEVLFSCEGRGCGHAAQWANRVFGQRVLYGRADAQRYRVHALRLDDTDWRVVLYSGARTSDRQYLHVDVLRIGTGDEASAPQLQE